MLHHLSFIYIRFVFIQALNASCPCFSEDDNLENDWKHYPAKDVLLVPVWAHCGRTQTPHTKEQNCYGAHDSLHSKWENALWLNTETNLPKDAAVHVIYFKSCSWQAEICVDTLNLPDLLLGLWSQGRLVDFFGWYANKPWSENSRCYSDKETTLYQKQSRIYHPHGFTALYLASSAETARSNLCNVYICSALAESVRWLNHIMSKKHSVWVRFRPKCQV